MMQSSSAAWGAVLHDDDLTAAIVERVLERSRLLHLDGPSMRAKHLGLDAPTLDELQPSVTSQALQPQRGRTAGIEEPASAPLCGPQRFLEGLANRNADDDRSAGAGT